MSDQETSLPKKKRNYWPIHAENARLDSIALSLDILHLTELAEAALLDDDAEEAQRLVALILKKTQRMREILDPFTHE